MNKINANTVLNLLLKKHSEDICVPECKAGASWSAAKTPRFDLWAMKRSYTKPMTWIYEIKVSRQDFLNDDKWQTYLLYCTDFYFVAPAGIIDVNEVPEQSGLLLTSKNGTRLYCKKKAPHRDVKVPDSVFKYILMSRSNIVNSTYNNNGKLDKKKYWQQWLANKNENHKLGCNVSTKIKQLYNKNVDKVSRNQNRIENELKRLENVERILKELGFVGRNLGWDYEQKIKDRIAELDEGFPEKSIIKHLESSIVNLKNTIDIIENNNKTKERKKIYRRIEK